jgi:two-component system, LytTR family, sensor kinase
MKTNYPIKKIVALNLWLTFYFVLFGFASSMANSGIEGFYRAIVSSVIISIVLFLNAFANLGLFLFFEYRYEITKSNYKTKFLVLSYGFSLLVFALVIIGYALIKKSPIQLSNFVFIIIVCFLINTLILAFQHYIVIQEAKVKADLENSQLKTANADAANQLLRQQIQPHFLFNALNILKSLYRVNTKSGEEYLIRLSDFLRAVVSSNNIKIIPLKDELKLCEDYLEMQKIRFSNGLTYSVAISEDALLRGYVPSFSIQPLLENAIKHNELTEESPLHIEIRQEGDRIRTTNNLQLKTTTEISTGSGLMNLAERYKHFSNDELIIEENNHSFSVSIKILPQAILVNS